LLGRIARKDQNIGVPADAPAAILSLPPSPGAFMPRLIELIVSPQGEATIQTQGYAGGDCLQASQFLEQALGIVASDQKTAEFYARETTPQQVTQ
jgi:hypothetical protein